MSGFSFNTEAKADDYFFGNLRNNSSKLQQLFDGDHLQESEKEQSLKYQRPKATDTKQSPKNETCTLIAKVATCFRQQQLLGRLGVALVKSAGNCLQIVLYKSKEHVLATLQLDNEKQNLFKQDRYWQFYDDVTKMDWSYYFGRLEDDEQFKNVLNQNGHIYVSAAKEKEAINLNLTQKEKTEPWQKVHGGDNIDLCNSSSLDQSKESCKPTLLQRMTKIGQPLPNLSKSSIATNNGEVSDSSDMEFVTTSTPVESKPYITPRNKVLTYKSTQKPLVPNSTVTLNTTPIFSSISNNLESQHLQMMLTEQRTQGSELRMNVNKLESKIEKVLDKLENIENRCGGNAKERDDEILELEEKILNLKKENRKLKQVIEESDNRKTFDLNSAEIIKRCQEDLHKFNISESTSIERVIQHCIEGLHDKKETIERQSKIIQDMEKHEKNVDHSLESRKLLEKQLQDEKHNVDLLKSDTEGKIKLIKRQQQQIQALQTELLAKTDGNDPPVDSVVKAIMNNLYADISSNLTASSCGDTAKVLSVVETSIRHQTLKALNELLPEEKEEE